MIKRQLFLGLFLLALIVALGCTKSADRDGNGGSSADGDELCEDFCDVLVDCFEEGDDCEEECKEDFDDLSEACVEAATDLLNCMKDLDCNDIVSECRDEVIEFEDECEEVGDDDDDDNDDNNSLS